MYTIDTSKVVQLVCLYARLPKSKQTYAAELAEAAAEHLGSRLLREPRSTHEMAACCHAAACMAVCDIARLNAAALEPAVTETGVYQSSGKSSSTSSEAQKLRDEALMRLGDMLDASDFFFEGVDTQ